MIILHTIHSSVAENRIFCNHLERKIVIAVRLGQSIPLHYNWFENNIPIGERVILNINRGDIYVMSEKATGNDGKKRKIPILRHAAGCKAYVTIKEKKKIDRRK